jgi:hypothetical protein
MSTVQTINYNVQFESEGIDTSIRNTQRLLYGMNAVRLAITDVQRTIKDPSIANIMWTAVQLTRVYTTLYRWVKAVNDEQRVAIGLGVVGRATGGGSAVSRMGAGLGQTTFSTAGGVLGFGIPATAKTGIWATVMGFAAANPLVAGAVIAAVATGMVVGWDIHQRQLHDDWRKAQREEAKAQGLEY